MTGEVPERRGITGVPLLECHLPHHVTWPFQGFQPSNGVPWVGPKVIPSLVPSRGPAVPMGRSRPQAVLDARNRVIDMVEDELRSFLNSVSSTIKTAYTTERHAKKLQHSLFGQIATITEEKNRLLSLRTW